MYQDKGGHLSVEMTKNPEYSKSNDNLSVQVCQPVKEREIIDVLNIYFLTQNRLQDQILTFPV